MIDAAEALAMGLVNRVVPHDDLLPTVYDTATALATLSSPRSIAVMKRLLYAHQFTDLAAATAEADAEMLASFPTEDFREGVASFLEKRPPAVSRALTRPRRAPRRGASGTEWRRDTESTLHDSHRVSYDGCTSRCRVLT
jgi:1,4-dihydroxy-2-naphthoyl-CoA synthase